MQVGQLYPYKNEDKNGISREELIAISEELQDIDDNIKTATYNVNEVFIKIWIKLELLDLLVKMKTLKLYQSLKKTSYT